MNNRGFSLASTLVAAGIMGILMLGFASMMQTQYREVRAIKQKVEAINLNQLILRVLQNSANCSCHLNAAQNTAALGPLTIDTTTSSIPDINLGEFRNGCDFSSTDNIIVSADASSPTNNHLLKVQEVAIKNITATGTTDEYLGKLVVAFNSSALVRPITPLSVDLVFSTDSSSGTPAARPIRSCAGNDVSIACNNLGGTYLSGKCMINEIQCVTEYSSFPSTTSPKRVYCPTDYQVTGCAFACSGHTTDTDGYVSAAGNYCGSNDTFCSGNVAVRSVCCRLE